MDKLSLDKQSAEDGIVMAKEAVEKKQKVIEELEVRQREREGVDERKEIKIIIKMRLEEAHSVVSAKATASSSQVSVDKRKREMGEGG